MTVWVWVWLGVAVVGLLALSLSVSLAIALTLGRIADEITEVMESESWSSAPLTRAVGLAADMDPQPSPTAAVRPD
jgi:hypothetical protein